MTEHSREEAVALMNTYGTQRCPFLFVIDYEAHRAIVTPLSDINPGECLYDFDGLTNSVPPSRYDGKAAWSLHTPNYDGYLRAFEAVKRAINAGDSYLVNLTCRMEVETDLSLRDLFHHTQARYRLWLRDRFTCFSPEIFVRINNGEISSFPMKGTIDASRPDALPQLMASHKEQAEHATIVDLIRNDLSQVARDVGVRRYRYNERIETCRGPIYQTSTEIAGQLPDDYPSHIGDIIWSMLPAGSITGAPKPSTCRIIRDAEGYSRGWYTGVAGYCDGTRLDGMVMIRYVEQDAEGRLWFKAGGGITSMSDPQDEYDEIITKAYAPLI